MIESPIDRELQRALAVDPSPEFRARVRTRIAGEPPPRRWGMRSMLASAAALAAAAAAAFVLSGRPAPHDPLKALPASGTLGQIALPVAPVKPNAIAGHREEARREVSPRKRGDQRVREETGRAAAADGVLVDPRESAALRRLLAGPVRAPEPFVGSSLDPIDIEPIVIAPLAPGGEGVRQ